MNEQPLNSDTQGGRVLASVRYFSIFFAPIILPIIIWIFADKPASTHAAKSLLYHVITYLGPIFIIIVASLGGMIVNQQHHTIMVIMIILGIILILFTIWYTIKNIYRGVKVLISESAYFNP